MRSVVEGAGVLDSLWPFGMGAAVGIASLLLPPSPQVAPALAAIALTLAVVAAAVFVPWHRLPPWAEAGPAFAYFGVVALLRHAQGGASSGYSPMLMLPFFWLALHCRRVQLLSGVVAAAAALAVPILVVGAPEYPTSEWRRVLLWIAIMPIVGFTIQRLVETVNRHSRTDPLTGLLNRRSLDEHLVRAMARARRLQEPLSIAMLDVDNFKRFNDEHGHLAGDVLLREAAASFLREARANDVVYRFGGEEFCVVLESTELEGATEAIERIRSTMPLGTTASAGLAQWMPTESAEQILGRADLLLYVAKSNGRNRVEVALPPTADP